MACRVMVYHSISFAVKSGSPIGVIFCDSPRARDRAAFSPYTYMLLGALYLEYIKSRDASIPPSPENPQ